MENIIHITVSLANRGSSEINHKIIKPARIKTIN